MTTKILSSILETIGSTPLVRINKMNKGKADVVGKVESFNPAGSVKDRIAIAMIEAAEKSGVLKPDTVIVEPTSGNTGIGLALVAAVKGYRLVLTMPDTMSMERRRLLKAYGAELVLTDGKQGMKGAVETAEMMTKGNPNTFMPMQFDNWQSKMPCFLGKFAIVSTNSEHYQNFDTPENDNDCCAAV